MAVNKENYNNGYMSITISLIHIIMKWTELPAYYKPNATK